MKAAFPFGGPAFPGTTINDGDLNLTDPFGTMLPPGTQATYSGMTLRDYFAAKALHNILGCGHQPNYEIAAADAYRYADAMLKARSA